LTPRYASVLSVFRSSSQLRKPSRLVVGAAAATVAATAGIAAGVSGASTPTNAASDPGAVNHATAPAYVHPSKNSSVRNEARAAQAASRASVPVAGTGAGTRPAGHLVIRTAIVRTAGAHPSRHRFADVKLVDARHRGHESFGHRTHDPAAARHQFPARHFAVMRRHAPAGSTEPYLIYDSTTPSALPAQHVAAAYATGSYAASAAQLAGHKRVVWIDTTGNDPAAAALDVEPGDATPALAANWAFHRLSEHKDALAVIYTMRSEWPAVQAAVGGLPPHMQARVRWWIADPTGYPHVVPGAAATQWYWGSSYDITTATPRF
jgi:hypothetical protein